MQVRELLARYVGVAPHQLVFGANDHGRPFLADLPAGATGHLSFNLTHTDGLIALAVARNAEIGIDAEHLGRHYAPTLAASVFASDEVEALQALAATQQHLRFVELWTLKESYMKARGLGLRLPLDQFSVDLRTDGRIALRCADGFGDTAARWSLRQFRPSPEHVLALGSGSLQKGQIDLLGLQSFTGRTFCPCGESGGTGTAGQDNGGQSQGPHSQVLHRLHVAPRWVRFAAGTSLRGLLKGSKRHRAT